MIDTGGPMAKPLSLGLRQRTQVVYAAKLIAKEFLDTLNVDDDVSVYTLDSTGAQLIYEKVSLVESQTQVSLLRLKEAIDGIIVSSAAAKANLTAGLESVLLPGGFDTSPSRAENLKIAHREQIVLSFIACAVNGVLNQIPRETILDDPISALQSFYSYVAYLRFEMDNKSPLWVPSYSAASNIGDVMAVSYPGVANIDLLGPKIEAKWPGALTLWKTPADIKHSSGRPLNCSSSLWRSDAFLCFDKGGFKRGLCPGESVKSSDELQYTKRTCCEGECWRTGSSTWKLIVEIVCPVGGCIFLCLCVLGWWCWKKNWCRKIPAPIHRPEEGNMAASEQEHRPSQSRANLWWKLYILGDKD
ncbi:hypothetical protein R1flu_023602 [Riccia fluitans]|uniref:Uncharacterized protein n=1 Tax=Riccia fluitans TaxID=41844 RepID=A0ABD1XSH8_9MARC